jgi:hypothetical protein
MEEIELFEWTYENLTDKKLFAWKRPLACPNCQNEDDGIAPIVWEDPIGNTLIMKKLMVISTFIIVVDQLSQIQLLHGNAVYVDKSSIVKERTLK